VNNSGYLTQWLNRFAAQGSLVRSVLVLLSGTALGHAITVLALPILTRLYTPTEFGALAVFSSVLSVISVAACLRFDIAIPIPKQDGQAFRILLLAIGSLLAIAVVLIVAIAVVPAGFWEIIGMKAIESYRWLIPVGLLSMGVYSILQNWFIRQKQFGFIAKSRVNQSLAATIAQISLFSFGALGLLIGYILNSLTACIVLGHRLLRGKRIFVNRKRLGVTFYVNRNFPKYSTWEALANSAAIQVPIIMIAALALEAEAGYLLLAMSVIQAPMSLFGNAIAQVFLSHAPDKYRERKLGEFSTEILAGLLKTGVGPLLALAILAPLLFGVIFGREWERSGWLVVWMMPWFILQFIASPLSMGIHIVGKQKIAFFLQISGLLLRVAFVWGASSYYPTYISEGYAISGAIFYLIYFIVILKCIGISFNHVILTLKKGGRLVPLWLVFAGIFLIIWKECEKAFFS